MEEGRGVSAGRREEGREGWEGSEEGGEGGEVREGERTGGMQSEE